MGTKSASLTSEDERAIQNFRLYLQIPSVHPNVNYDQCVKFLQGLAKELNLPCKVVTVAPDKPVVLISWHGTKPSLPSILLNSHMDVVPVYEEKWTKKPFAADVVDGKIYGRGAQDMKSVGIQYLEAIRRLKKTGVTLKRTIHVSFVPDEEIGGDHGMKGFVQMQEFKELNVGFAMDEAVANKYEEYFLFYAERYIWEGHIHCTGKSGHASFMEPKCASEKATYIMNKINEYRNKQIGIVGEELCHRTADVVSINVTTLSGGLQLNVVPSEFLIGFDCRIPPSVDEKEWEKTLKQWCAEAGDGVFVEFHIKEEKTKPTVLNDSNPYWVALESAFEQSGIKVQPMICPGTTDARYIRKQGICAVGFTPINETRALLHNHDEFVRVDSFIKGINIYCNILTKVGNID